MKRTVTLLGIATLLLALLLPVPPAAYAAGIPTFSIVSVVAGQSVTIRTSNFPAHDNFRVTMGAIGTRGVGGVVVGFTDSGDGGSFVATYSIPSTIASYAQISIRLQSPTSGYFAYNWFYNSGTSGSPGPTPQPGYTGVPYFFIASVAKDSTVTINAYNFPANDSFTVLMGPYGSRGVGGVVIETISTGSGGAFTDTYNIPASLAGSERIAIRLQSSTSGYFAYNWFWNNTANTGSTPPPTPPPAPGYTGFPYFFISAVAKGSTVTINAYNFPPNETFTVTMGPYGSQGIGGVVVENISTGSGGAFTDTYSIPASLAGAQSIAIRLQSTTSGYFGYNWFWNNNAP